jgi:hypothetical protein
MALFPQTKTAEDIHERDARHLLAACRLPEYDEKGQPNRVPAPVVNFYWQVKQHFDRVGGTIFQPDTYAVIAATGYALAALTSPAKSTEPAPAVGEEELPNVAALFHSKQIAHGDTVLVNWREEWVEGRIVGASVNRKQVTVTIDGEDRKVPTTTVKLPEAAMV